MSQPKEEKMYFIYVLDLKDPFRDIRNWNDDITQIAEDHHRYFIELGKAGTLILAGRSKYEISNPENFGIMVFQADSQKEAEQIMYNDPGIKGGLMNAKLHPFSIAVLKTVYE